MMKLYAESGLRLAKFKKVNDDGELYWDFTDATEEELQAITTLETATYMEGRGPASREVKRMKIGALDPLMALDKLARAYGLYQDNLNLSGETSLVDRINAGRKRAGLDKKKGSKDDASE